MAGNRKKNNKNRFDLEKYVKNRLKAEIVKTEREDVAFSPSQNRAREEATVGVEEEGGPSVEPAMNKGCKKRKRAPKDDEQVRDFVEMRLRCAVYGRRLYFGRDGLVRLLKAETKWLEEWDEGSRWDAETKRFKPSKLKRFVGDFLKKQEWWQTTRAPGRERPTVPYIAQGPRVLVQVDMIGPFGKEGRCQKRFALVIVELFTRRAWTGMMQGKSAKESWRVMQKALTDMFGPRNVSKVDSDKLTKRQRESRRVVLEKYGGEVTISSDQGSEFVGQGFMDQVDKGWGGGRIKLKQSFGTSYRATNQAYVERLNKTLKTWMFKQQQGEGVDQMPCFEGALERVTQQYNELHEHSAHGMTPEDAEKLALEGGSRGAAKVKRELERVAGVRLETRAKQKGLRLPRVKVGDYVRILLARKALKHMYADNWSKVVYRVKEVVKPKPVVGLPSTQGRELYVIENAETGEVKKAKNGAAFRYSPHELLKVPARGDGGEEGYHAQVRPNMSLSEMRALCNRCDVDKEADRLIEERGFVDPSDEVVLDQLPAPPSAAKAMKELEDSAGFVQQKPGRGRRGAGKRVRKKSRKAREAEE